MKFIDIERKYIDVARLKSISSWIAINPEHVSRYAITNLAMHDSYQHMDFMGPSSARYHARYANNKKNIIEWQRLETNSQHAAIESI
jgi:hypothetical protein